jgi:tetraacyldisaccharide 4'-kinase
VHAVAAIGNPDRFFDTLRGNGMQVIEHAYPDHAPLRPEQLDFGDNFDILMTEKDAVKFPRQVRTATGTYRLMSRSIRLSLRPGWSRSNRA